MSKWPVTYWSGPSSRYVFKSPETLALTASKMAPALHRGVVAPVPMIMSHGLMSSSLAANLNDPPQKSINTSSTDWMVEWRKQTGNVRPGVKNSQAGNWGLETMVAVPWPPTPIGWVPRWPLIIAFAPKSSLSLLVLCAILAPSKIPGGGRGCRKKKYNNTYVTRRKQFSRQVKSILFYSHECLQTWLFL